MADPGSDLEPRGPEKLKSETFWPGELKNDDFGGLVGQTPPPVQNINLEPRGPEKLKSESFWPGGLKNDDSGCSDLR